MIKKLFLVLFFLVILESSFVFSQSDGVIESLYVLEQEDKFQVAFGFESEFIDLGSEFHIDVLLDNELVLENLCYQEFNEKSSLYSKITCPIEKLGDGEYEFRGSLFLDEELISQNLQKITLLGDVSSSFSFKEVAEGTQIIINVVGRGENLIILSDIPGSVISYLDDENKDEFIISENDFEILESNPLIAWNVEKIPTNITYTIKKNISQKDRNDFALEIRESEETHFMTYLIFGLLIVFLIFIFKPSSQKKVK